MTWMTTTWTTRNLPRTRRTTRASDSLTEDKIEAGIDSEEDLLDGIPEEELKATVEAAALPEGHPRTKARARNRAKRNADAGVTMLTGDPVRMYLKEIGKVPAAHRRRGDRPGHEDRGRRGRHRGAGARRGRGRGSSSAARSAASAASSRWAWTPSSSSSRPTCAWWSPLPSAMWAAACCFWT